MDNNLWINKWKPTSVNDIIGNKQSIQKIDEWLAKFDKHNSNAIIISGSHGIGKTLSIELLLEKYNYTTKIIYPDELKTFRNDMDFEDYYNYENSVFSKFKINTTHSKTSEKKLALVFDEIESISLTSEKKYVLNIFKTNAKTKSFPLIFISNTNHSKLLTDLKKYCPEVKFFSPSSYELNKFVQKICSNENIKIENIECIEKLIQFSQYDVRRLINLLQEYNYNHSDGKLNNVNIDNFINKSISKDTSIGLFDAALELLNNSNNFEKIFKLYEIDKVLIPLMVHENYYKKIMSSKNKMSFDEQLDEMIDISESISIGDTIETSIYTDQNWYLQDIHGFYTCFNTSYSASRLPRKITSSEIKFSADLNKTSLKNINRKNIANLEKIIGKKSIDEILLLCKITNHMISSKQTQTILKLLKEYKDDLDIKDLELCLKIDKTIDFITLSTKEKKEITNMI